MVCAVARWLLLLALLLAAPATATQLVYTTPCVGQAVTGAGDSLSVECAGGPALVESMTVCLWGQPISGGGFAPVDSHRVAPCVPDSFTAPWPGHFFAAARNRIGLGCAGNVAYNPPPVLTGVPVVRSDPIILCRLWNVQGRLLGAFPGRWWDLLEAHRWRLAEVPVGRRLASGIYYLRGTTRSGLERRKELRILR